AAVGGMVGRGGPAGVGDGPRASGVGEHPRGVGSQWRAGADAPAGMTGGVAMPSPFPGMDPYLESWIWEDCHNNMIGAFRAQLNAKLPRGYVANTDLYVWREDAPEQDRSLVGGRDVRIAESTRRTDTAIATAAVAAPVTTVLPGVERKQRYLRVLDNAQRRVVTVIEPLSPANKTAHGNGEAYRFKRGEY